MSKRPMVCAVLVTLACLSAAGATLAHAGALPGNSEFGISGTYVHPQDTKAVWLVDAQVAMPVGEAGYVVLGPKVRFSSDDSTTAAGVVLELNFAGSSHTGLYIGANGLYNLKDGPGGRDERYTVDAVAGFKFQLGEHGCAGGCGGFKAYVSKTVFGRDSFDSDITGNLGLFVRF